MKKLSFISYFLLIFSMFAIGCSNNTSEDAKNIENHLITLNVITSSDEKLIATKDNIRYQITNSQINITDDKDNPLSWNELKDAKVIEVHYPGKIKEVSPAIFDKIIKVVILS